MKPNPISQHGAAIALVQLLEEHPELSKSMSWTIGRVRPHLMGFVHEGGLAVLNDCVGIVGGEVTVGAPYEQRGGLIVRQHVLASEWRDVSLEIVVSLPVAAQAVAA
ncbi:hypothetical protein [Streptomyces sp. NPDC056188]|uniref:hypothetical protein n=1 Tax=Streptomyces sp. NPDC056188 TaxID=3345740 RepID=UPI0035D78971